MNLENSVKYHSPKSQKLDNSSTSTSSDVLSGTDIMAAFGFIQSREPLGLSAFCGKIGLSEEDKKKAVHLLTRFGLKHCDKVAALRKLDTKNKVKVVMILAKFAYADYCRSANDVKKCDICKGRGLIQLKKWDAVNIRYDSQQVFCKKCNGKGTVSTACKKCSGRGTAVDREETEKHGVPIRKSCKQCSGRGYERIPAASAFSVVNKLAPSITQNSWKRGVKKFYDSLINELVISEDSANRKLIRVTK